MKFDFIIVDFRSSQLPVSEQKGYEAEYLFSVICALPSLA